MKPLFVDLDGTLLLNDSVQEIFFRLLAKNPLRAIASIFLLITQGKAIFKDYMAQQVCLKDIQWPINPLVLQQLQIEKQSGRKIILLTASHEIIAESIVAPLKLFDQIVGSTKTRNFKGKQKVIWIQQHFPNQPFDYMGNSTDDYVVWQQSEQPIVVNPSKAVLQQAKKISAHLQLIQHGPGKLSLWLRMLRVHQWSKNLLIFVPLLLSGQLLSFHLVFACFLAWGAFSAIASAGYLLNDLLDVDHDRKHDRKKFRPFAAGQINFSSVAWALVFLFAIAAAIVCWLPKIFSFVLIIYFMLTLSYSFWFKRIAVLDVFILSALYLLRLAAGSAATGIVISYWLFAFALFFFLSLAYLKRFIEVEKIALNETLCGRNYTQKDLLWINISGISLGFLSVLIFSLYLSSKATIAIYQYPQGLWLVAVLLLYWINHLWYYANHRKIQDDPVAFALSDPISIAIICCALIILLFCQGFF